jgi:hypothetical protein
MTGYCDGCGNTLCVCGSERFPNGATAPVHLDAIDLVHAAIRVCNRWDADDVDDGAMDADIVHLRRVADLIATAVRP